MQRCHDRLSVAVRGGHGQVAGWRRHFNHFDGNTVGHGAFVAGLPSRLLKSVTTTMRPPPALVASAARASAVRNRVPPDPGAALSIAARTPPRLVVGATISVAVSAKVTRAMLCVAGVVSTTLRAACCASANCPGAERLSDVSSATTVVGSGSADTRPENTGVRTRVRAAPAR